MFKVRREKLTGLNVAGGFGCAQVIGGPTGRCDVRTGANGNYAEDTVLGPGVPSSQLSLQTEFRVKWQVYIQNTHKKV